MTSIRLKALVIASSQTNDRATASQDGMNASLM